MSTPSSTGGRSFRYPTDLCSNSLERVTSVHVTYTWKARWMRRPGWGLVRLPGWLPHPGPHREDPRRHQRRGSSRFPWETDGRQILPIRANSGRLRLTRARKRRPIDAGEPLTCPFPTPTVDPDDHSYSRTGRPLNSGGAACTRSSGREMGKDGVHNPAPTTSFSHTPWRYSTIRSSIATVTSL